MTQLITDFGRTTSLVSSADYQAKAQNENAAATRQQILLAVDQAFYNALPRLRRSSPWHSKP